MAAAGILALASFAIGLTGFGIGLISMAMLPFVMAPATAVLVVTIYTVVFTLGMLASLWRDVRPGSLLPLLAGTVIGMPAGVWLLISVPPGFLKRIIGLVLLVVVVVEWRGLYPRALPGRGWAVGAGILSGALGAGMATPGPPVILYAAAQRWEPRTIRANLQAFFFVNQVVILAGYWWAGLLTSEVARAAFTFAAPAAAGVVAGAACFRRIDERSFRRAVFALLLVSGLVLLLGG
jgi:uncharacterized membrane protein YfcA